MHPSIRREALSRFLRTPLARIARRVGFGLALLCSSPTFETSLRAQQAVGGDHLADVLATLETEIAAQHPALRALRARLASVRAQAEATGRLGPATLSTGLSEAPASALDQGNLRLALGREVGSAARRQAERARADVEIQEMEALLEAARRALAPTLLRALVQSVGTGRIVERLNAEDALLADAEQGLLSRLAVGEARFVDVLRVRTERLRVQTERAELQAVSAASQVALRSLVADTESGGAERLARVDSLLAHTPLTDWRTRLPSAADASALAPTALDVRLADIALSRAELSRTLGLAARRTRAEAYLGVERVGQATGGPALGPSAGITVTLPRTARAANERAALSEQLEIDASVQTRRAITAAADARLAAARAHYVAALRRIDTFDSALLLGAREERDGALAAYRAQQLSLLELLDFERALARAEIAALAALINAADAYASLRQGGGDAADALVSFAMNSFTLTER